MPPPLRVDNARVRKPNEYYDFVKNTFYHPGERTATGSPEPSSAINTLGEVPDSPWYQNRQRNRRMSIEEMARGPNVSGPPAQGTWQVISAKTEGIMPGFEIKDAQGTKFLIKFDPPGYPDLATAADVVGAKFFYAFGYNVPENYIVWFTRQQVRAAPNATIRDETGRVRPMKDSDIDSVLRRVEHQHDGHYRAIASRFLGGEIIGPFRFYGLRADDPNDIVPHENRRDLRGLRVFAAWLNHTDSKSLNTLDSIVEENGLRYIRHHLIDFGASLGSDSISAKSPRAGNVYLFAWKPSAAQFFSLGIYTPLWMRAYYPHIPSVGNFESEVFDPLKWKSNYPNAAFERCLPGDGFWAARQVMQFTEPEIRAMVTTGEYSDPRAIDYITRTLVARREKIGRSYFAQVLPLDNFRVRDGKLEFDDLNAKHGFAPARNYSVRWYRTDNASGTNAPLAAPGEFAVPNDPAEYLAAEIEGPDTARKVTVYVRNHRRIVGIERAW